MQKQPPEKFWKKLFLKFRNIRRKTPVLETLFNSEYCEIFQSTYYEEHLRTVTDSCMDGWNVRNCSSSHVHVFGDRWSEQIGDGWSVRNWSIYCEIWISILRNLRCLRYKSINFVLMVKPTLMSLFWLFGLCLFVCYVWFIKLGCIRCRCGKKESILNFALSRLCLVNIYARVDKKKI